MGTISERKTIKGKVVFDAAVRRKGRPTAYKTFNRLTDARLWVQETEFNLRSGRYLPQAESQRHTLGEAIDRYIEGELCRKLKTWVDRKRQLLWFKKEIGFKLLADVTPAVLSELKTKYLGGVNRHGQTRKPQSWNRCLSAISGVLQMCVYEWQWLEFNPARRVKREREARGRVRFLSDDERTRLLDACKQSRSPNLYPLVVLTLSTGMRRGEVTWLTWDRVDLAAGVLILEDTKNGERRRVPVRGLALDLLREHAKVRRIDTSFVFPGEHTKRTSRPFELAAYWNDAVNEAALKDFRFHDLRHSTASYLAMRGATLLEIAEVLGAQNAPDGETILTSRGVAYGEGFGADEPGDFRVDIRAFLLLKKVHIAAGIHRESFPARVRNLLESFKLPNALEKCAMLLLVEFRSYTVHGTTRINRVPRFWERNRGATAILCHSLLSCRPSLIFDQYLIPV